MRRSRFGETGIVHAVKEQDCLPVRPVWSSDNCALEGLFCTPYGTTLELLLRSSSPGGSSLANRPTEVASGAGTPRRRVWNLLLAQRQRCQNAACR